MFPKILHIHVEPNALLRKKAEDFDLKLLELKDTKDFFDALFAMMTAADGIGIAAPQVGVSLRICIVSDNGKNHQLLINPEITWASKEMQSSIEGCLSVPHMYGDVARPKAVHVKALDINGKKIKIKAKAMLARVIQHEIDHLNGILFVDKATNIFKSKSENVKI